MNKKTIAIGFMLFALFFGAGNLIFPPSLGWRSGDTFHWMILGFIMTGVGLPLIGVVAGLFSEHGFNSEARRVHPAFAVLFMVTIYLTIGPFFAIPRTAATAFEMGAASFLDPALMDWRIGGFKPPLLIFSSLYFLLVFALSVKPNRIVDVVGKVLTPLLLLSIIALVVKAFFVLNEPVTDIASDFNANAPFMNGFLDGYETMDTIAAVAFSIIVLKAVRATGLNTHKEVFSNAFKAALIAGGFLALIYLALGWIGNHYPISVQEQAALAASKQHYGTYILTQVAAATYGSGGKLLLAIVVTLACLTTAIGLIVSVSSYFYELWPKHSYKTYAIIFTLISFVLANQGLSQVIQGSIPVLRVIYPITIVMIALIFIDRLFKGIPDLCFQLAIGVTVLVSLLSQVYPASINWLPFAGVSMQWVLPAIAGLVIGTLGMFRKKNA